MNYTLHQLKIFYNVAHYQSITKASEAMHLTQPAVSIQLKNFQDQFSIPLTEVVGRRLYITDFGREIAEAAESIIHQVEAINYKTHAFEGEIAGRLTISTASTAKYVMPYFLTDFMEANPGVDLVMDVTNKSRVVESLEENAVDFAMVSVLPEHLKVNRVELMQNKLYLVTGSRRKLPANYSKADIFRKQPLLFREPGSATRMAMETFMNKYNYENPKRIELTSNEALKQALIAGLGYSIMPLIGIKNALGNGDLEIIPVRGLPMITHWNLIWLKSKNLSPTAAAYLEFVQREKDRIIQEHFGWFEKY
ncbi:DNA-binding transcriptional regulator, LysR family [Robiginitalea myxolifaciens]|uniref:DNA-binding transcriptional regulator, LysR family n=1 Tax=Robiginitalea myxolifaciens TaxID=400055 RepID=A0A1I6H691_9FLAO|nr:LysR substrate-binding domain-containing protein [Robiginitalea myxolifaciens]SFR49857.1 DNA-binding transcriptional regulator, LysR family [Robiginitalea myxolifaciens]